MFQTSIWYQFQIESCRIKYISWSGRLWSNGERDKDQVRGFDSSSEFIIFFFISFVAMRKGNK